MRRLTSALGRIMLSAVTLRALMLVALLAAPTFSQTPKTNPFAQSAPDIDVGGATFRIYCSPCHGIGAAGGRGPDLTRGVYSAGDSDADLFKVISEGVSGTEMPSYGSHMTEETLWRVVSYVRSMAKVEAPPDRGDAEKGRALYAGKGGCSGCHQLDGRGGRLGPDLTRVGRSRSAAYLTASLLDPSADLTPGFGTVEVVDSGGRTISGIERNFDNFSVALMDTSEKFHTFSREGIRSARRTQRSLMPSYRETLTAAEIDDLVAYLSRLGRSESIP